MLSSYPAGRRTTSFPTFQNTTHAVEYVKENLCWFIRESLSLHPNLLLLNFEGLCPEFDHIMVMQFAYVAHIPEMVQAIFYAMEINNVAELGLSNRDAMGRMMVDLQELRWDIVEAWLLSIDERLRDAQVPPLLRWFISSAVPESDFKAEGCTLLSSDEE